MAIKKQEFYEGAALHRLARFGGIASLHYKPPFFAINDHFLLLLKYSTRSRSPWGFTFTPQEQRQLDDRARESKTIIGLICGSDGVAALPYELYRTIAPLRTASIHVSCYRNHDEHYEVNGPEGALNRKIAPSNWQRVLVG